MQPLSDVAIDATGLVKHFGSTRAVDGLDLDVRTGAVYGVLGPNQATSGPISASAAARAAAASAPRPARPSSTASA